MGPTGPTPTAVPVKHPQRTVMGGGVYQVNLPIDKLETEWVARDLDAKITPEEIEEFFRWKRQKQDEDVVDLRPMFLDRMVREARDARWALRRERDMARAEREELELLRAQIAREREGLAEESAVLMREKKGLLDAGSMFHGGVPVVGEGLDFSNIPVRTKHPEQEPSKVWDEVVVPVGIGFGIGAGVTVLALFVKEQLERGKKKAVPEKKDDGDDSDGLVIRDDG